MIEDKVLVWRSKCGNQDALRRIYEKYKNGLLTLARGLLNNTTEAEDVVHDVFVSFVRDLPKFQLTGSLKGYLATCVANLARDYLRSGRHRTSTLPKRTLDDSGLRQRESNPDQQLIHQDELLKVKQALNRLPYEQREAVVLYLQSGLTFKRIAQLQNVSLNTVQGRYRYGMEKLRHLLNGQRS